MGGWKNPSNNEEFHGSFESEDWFRIWKLTSYSCFGGSSQRKWYRRLRHQTYTPESWFPQTFKFPVEVGTPEVMNRGTTRDGAKAVVLPDGLLKLLGLTPKANHPASCGLFKQTMISNEACNENNITYQNHSKSPGVCQKIPGFLEPQLFCFSHIFPDLHKIHIHHPSSITPRLDELKGRPENEGTGGTSQSLLDFVSLVPDVYLSDLTRDAISVRMALHFWAWESL